MSRMLLVVALLLAVTVCVSAQCSSYRNCAECASQSSCYWCQSSGSGSSSNEWLGSCISSGSLSCTSTGYPYLVSSRSMCYSSLYASAQSYTSCFSCASHFGYSWCSLYSSGSSSNQIYGTCTTAGSSYCRWYGTADSSYCYTAPSYNYHYSSSVNGGVIAGAVIGSVSFIVFIVLLVWCLRRRAIYRAQSAVMLSQQQPSIVVAAQPQPVYAQPAYPQQPYAPQPYQPPQYAPGQAQPQPQAYAPQGYAPQGNPQQPQAYARMQ